MTEEEAIICKIYLEDLDKYHTCNEYKLLMGLLEQEPCDDAISRQAAIDACLNGWNKDYKEIVEEIRSLPPVTPAEKVGQWIARGLVDSNGNRIYECSECHHSDIQAATMIVPYCWYCGAKMQEVDE